MKFTEIHRPTCSKRTIQFIDTLIQQKIFNDAVFESCFIQADVILDSPIQMFYRTMWETMYLRRQPKWYVLNENHAIIQMSISECIQYLQEITPPKCRDLLDKDMTSVDNIYQMICGFLQDETDPQHPFYLTKFYEVFHTNLFNNAWTPNYKKIAMLRNIVKDDIICIVDAATVSVQDIMDCDGIQEDTYAQVSFHVDTEDAMEKLYRFIENNELMISGLQCNDIGLFVSAYASRICPGLSRMIRDTYSQILKK